jgi:2',3'-cyclic-nucleotide 2'-phosphodiesterase (5'-nucleotidase family)
LTSEFPDVAAFIAGHTHQAIPSRLTNNVLFTQADHFGIHMGRVDLFFDRTSKKLLRREAICELMDNRFPPDQVVISRVRSQLAESELRLGSRSANWRRFYARGAGPVTPAISRN